MSGTATAFAAEATSTGFIITNIPTACLVDRVNTVGLRFTFNSISSLENQTHINNKAPVRTAQ
jgi:hypothetical protein